MMCESQSVKYWPLEKYAKFIATSEGQATQTDNQGHWKQFSPSPNGSSCLQLTLLQSNLVVSDGKIIHENFSLFNAKKWLQAVVKGDSMLIIYKMNNGHRRFRIKFGKSTERSATENCRQFMTEISLQIPVQEISTGTNTESDSQMQIEDPLLILHDSQHVQVGRATGPSAMDISMAGASPRGLSLTDLAIKISSSESHLDDPQSPAGHMGIPKDRLSLLIRLCLTDSNFPAFVEAVEKELTNLISSENDSA